MVNVAATGDDPQTVPLLSGHNRLETDRTSRENGGLMLRGWCHRGDVLVLLYMRFKHAGNSSITSCRGG